MMAALKEDTRVNNNPVETLPEDGGVRQNTSNGTKIDKHLPPSRRRIGGVYGFALLLALVLFYFHVMVIFDVLGEMLRYKAWMLEHLGPKDTGKLLLLGCFFVLLWAHVAEAAVWGLFFRGDILLKYPWRHLGTLIAITGVLMFGCSTAFLFVVLQNVWQHF